MTRHKKAVPGHLRSSAPAIAATIALALGVSGCGDDGTATTVVSTLEPPVTAAVLPPTTYIISPTGPFSGSIESIGSSGGSIRFAIQETAASTHETLADGQIIVYDFAVVNLEVTLDLVDHPCGDRTVSGSFTVSVDDPIHLVSGSTFQGGNAQLTVSGDSYGSVDGSLTATISPLDDGPPCTYGPAEWTASGG